MGDEKNPEKDFEKEKKKKIEKEPEKQTKKAPKPKKKKKKNCTKQTTDSSSIFVFHNKDHSFLLFVQIVNYEPVSRSSLCVYFTIKCFCKKIPALCAGKFSKY